MKRPNGKSTNEDLSADAQVILAVREMRAARRKLIEQRAKALAKKKGRIS